MSQTNTRSANGQTARDARSAQQRAASLFSVTLVLFLLPCAAFAEELGAVGNAAGWAESEGSATAASPGKAPFTFSPDVRLINSALLFGRRSLLAQTHTGALAAAPTVNLTTPGPWGTQKSYLIPALEIVGFDVLLNLFDRAYYGCCDFDVDLSSIKRNLRRGWNVDRDKFTVNQVGLPIKDRCTTVSRAPRGWLLGRHGLHLLRQLVLGNSRGNYAAVQKRSDQYRNWRQLPRRDAVPHVEPLARTGEDRISGVRSWRPQSPPPVGFNRLAFGDRFDGIFPSNHPQYYGRLQVGIVSTAQDRRDSSKEIKRHEGIVDFALDYGLPGKPSYTYNRPFDYFSFQAAASTAIGFESVSTRGLLLGTDYGLGKNYRGIWGLYGNYSYMAPQIFRFASTGLSLGTTGEWRLADSLALQGTGPSASATPASATLPASPMNATIITESRPRHCWRCGSSSAIARPST